jgi:hypothetical protein
MPGRLLAATKTIQGHSERTTVLRVSCAVSWTGDSLRTWNDQKEIAVQNDCFQTFQTSFPQMVLPCATQAINSLSLELHAQATRPVLKWELANFLPLKSLPREPSPPNIVKTQEFCQSGP